MTAMAKPLVQQSRRDGAVSRAELAVAGAVVFVAAISFVSPDYGYLTFIARVLLAMNLALTAITVRTTVRTGAFGRCLLIVGALIFFWVEAASTATQSVPFATDRLMRLPTRQFSPHTVAMSFLSLAVFQFALLMGYSSRLSTRRLENAIARRHDRRDSLARVLPPVLAGATLLALFLNAGGDLGAVISALVASRTAKEDVGLASGDFLPNVLYYIGLFGTALLFTRALSSRDGRVRYGILVLAGVFALPFVLGGARHQALFIALPAIAFLWRRFSQDSGSRSSSRLRVAGLIVGVVAVLQLQFVLRPTGWNQLDALRVQRLFDANVTKQYTAVLFATDLVPARHDYFWEVYEPYFLTHWVPRQVWPNKPEIRSWRYFDDNYTRGTRGANYTPTVVGQYHMSGGLPAVLIAGLWLGLLARIADKVFRQLRPEDHMVMGTVCGMFYAFVVAAFRFYAPYYFAPVVIAGAFGLLLTRRRSRRNDAEEGAPDSVPTALVGS